MIKHLNIQLAQIMIGDRSSTCDRWRTNIYVDYTITTGRCTIQRMHQHASYVTQKHARCLIKVMLGLLSSASFTQEYENTKGVALRASYLWIKVGLIHFSRLKILHSLGVN